MLILIVGRIDLVTVVPHVVFQPRDLSLLSNLRAFSLMGPQWDARMTSTGVITEGFRCEFRLEISFMAMKSAVKQGAVSYTEYDFSSTCL